MTRSSIISTLMFAGALAMSTPALAQHGGGHGGGGGHASGGGSRSSRSMGAGVRGGGGGARMGGSVGVPRGGGGAVRGPYVGGGGVYRGATAYRGGSAYRGGAIYGSRAYSGLYYGGRYWNVAPIRYYHPYYSFRPYFSLGFGLWAGYPVSWAYPYYYPDYYASAYPYPYPYPYSDQYPQYPATGGPGYSVAPPVNVSPNTPNTQNEAGLDQGNLGGMSFEISPGTAQIFIDGNLAGTVGQFTPSSQPLGVPAGRHHVEIHLDGYKTMSFDVDIVAGQVIPYQGQMER